MIRGRVQTVLGLIEPNALGSTLMHEHLLCDLNSPALEPPSDPEPAITLQNVFALNYGRHKHFGRDRLDQMDVAILEMIDLFKAGGATVVELSSGGLAPDPLGLREISQRSRVNVVMGCGHYVEEFQDAANFSRSVEDFGSEMIAQVFDGAWGTDVRAGIIGEIGCSVPWTDLEKQVMRGAVLAQGETGATISVHPGADPDQALDIINFIQKAGGDVERVIICHIDRTIFDQDRLLRLADSGCVLEYDFFGMEKTYWPLGDVDLPNDGTRLGAIRTLIEHGHLSRVIISHDICRKTRLVRFGGHGYTHIFVNVLPLMRSRGFSEREIDAVLDDNPRRLLTFV